MFGTKQEAGTQGHYFFCPSRLPVVLDCLPYTELEMQSDCSRSFPLFLKVFIHSQKQRGKSDTFSSLSGCYHQMNLSLNSEGFSKSCRDFLEDISPVRSGRPGAFDAHSVSVPP